MCGFRCHVDLERVNVWSAEEWQKFCYPISEIVFNGILPDEEYHIVWLTAKLVHLIFNNRGGFSKNLLEVFQRICFRRAIKLEENVGPTECVITCHETLHIAQYIRRFGDSDN